MRLPIHEAPRDGRVCLIGGGPPGGQLPDFRAWAWYDIYQNAWREVGYGGITFHPHSVEWYYPNPFGRAGAGPVLLPIGGC